MPRKIFLSFILLSFNCFSKDLVFSGQDYPPLNWQQGSEVTGGMTEVMKHICFTLKKKCSFVIAPVARVMKMVEEGTNNGGISLIPAPDRENSPTFLFPLSWREFHI